MNEFIYEKEVPMYKGEMPVYKYTPEWFMNGQAPKFEREVQEKPKYIPKEEGELFF